MQVPLHGPSINQHSGNLPSLCFSFSLVEEASAGARTLEMAMARVRARHTSEKGYTSSAPKTPVAASGDMTAPFHVSSCTHAGGGALCGVCPAGDRAVCRLG